LRHLERVKSTQAPALLGRPRQILCWSTIDSGRAEFFDWTRHSPPCIRGHSPMPQIQRRFCTSLK
jgi:hypothetical protein